jgi:hypothetical protein
LKTDLISKLIIIEKMNILVFHYSLKIHNFVLDIVISKTNFDLTLSHFSQLCKESKTCSTFNCVFIIFRLSQFEIFVQIMLSNIFDLFWTASLINWL